MTAFLLAIGFVLVAQVATDDNAAVPGVAAKEAIEKAISELGHKSFAVREAASKFLWKQGLAAEPALKEALKNKDIETRARARMILKKLLTAVEKCGAAVTSTEAGNCSFPTACGGALLGDFGRLRCTN